MKILLMCKPKMSALMLTYHSTYQSTEKRARKRRGKGSPWVSEGAPRMQQDTSVYNLLAACSTDFTLFWTPVCPAENEGPINVEEGRGVWASGGNQ
jgi:hypothetical protein